MSVTTIPQHLVDQMEPDERAAYKLYLERQLAITDVWTYIQTVSPWVEPYPNILVLCEYLDALTEGRLYKDGPGPFPVCVGTRMERSGKRIVEVPIMQHPETGEEPVYNLGIYEPPRHGKLCAHSTKVFTPQGERLFGDLKVGDQVFGPTGAPVVVQGLSPDGVASVEVVFANGATVKVHPNHEWQVYDRDKHCTRTLETHQLRGFKNGRARFQIPQAAALQMPERNLTVDPYTLGVWLGDGKSSSAAVCGSEQDLYHIVDRIPYERGYVSVHMTTGALYQGFKGLQTLLRQIGVLNNKHIPEDYQLASETQRRALLAGLVDTDGSVDPNGRTRFVGVNKTLCKDVQRLVRSLGYRCELRVRPASDRDRAIRDVQDCYEVDWTPHDGVPQGTLPRKSVSRTRRPRAIGIKEIRPCAPEPGRCIQVEGGLYLVGEELVATHNSLCVSEHYPGYIGTKFPGTKIANASYGDDLAAELSSLLQTHVEEGRQTFGMGVEGGTKAGKYRWKFENGSDYLCGGRGSGFSGFGWMLGIADDLFKDRADSDSAANRNTVGGWWTSTWWTRRERWFDRTPARAVLMNTRWHPDDISGRIVEGSNKWCVLRIPALAEEGEVDILGRLPGEALIPEIMDAVELGEIRDKNPLDFASLYQGRPYLTGGNVLHGPFNTCSLEGGLYKLVFESGETIYVPEAACFRFQIIDLAASKKTTADWTVIGTFDVTPAELGPRRMILRALKRMRITTENHEGEVIAEYKRHGAKFIGVEDKTFGTNLIGQLKKHGGVTVRPLKADTDKVTRALPVDSLIKNEELWWMAEAAFRMDLEMEVLLFPDGDHDDQVDVLAYAGRVFQSLPRAKRPPKREPSGMEERVAAHLAKITSKKRKGFNHPVLGRL